MSRHSTAALIAAAGLFGAGLCAVAQTADDLALAITIDNADLQSGVAGLDSATLSVIVENGGNAEVTVDLMVPLVDGLKLTTGMAAVAMPGAYDETTGIWSVGALAAGAFATLSIPVTLEAQASGCLVQTAALISAPDIESTAVIGTGNCSDLQALLRAFPEECPAITGTIVIRIIRQVENAGPNAVTSVVALVAGNDNAPDASCTAVAPCTLSSGETRLVAERELPVACSESDQVFNFELEVGSGASIDPNLSNNKASQIHTVPGVASSSGGAGSGGGAALVIPLALLVLLWYRRLNALSRRSRPH